MQPWITAALAQAGLGIWAVVATIACLRLLKRNEALTDQIIGKAETDKRVNTEAAAAMQSAVAANTAALQNFVNAVAKRARKAGE